MINLAKDVSNVSLVLSESVRKCAADQRLRSHFCFFLFCLFFYYNMGFADLTDLER